MGVRRRGFLGRGICGFVMGVGNAKSVGDGMWLMGARVPVV